jgi:hypothetical protein
MATKFTDYSVQSLTKTKPTISGSSYDTTYVLETSAATTPGSPVTVTVRAYPPVSDLSQLKLEAANPTLQAAMVATKFVQTEKPGVYQASVTVSKALEQGLELYVRDTKGNLSNGSVVSTVSAPKAEASNYNNQVVSTLNQTSAMSDASESNKAKAGTYDAALKKLGMSEPTSRSTQTTKGRTGGAVETAVAGYRSLAEALAANHKYDEFSKLRVWVNLSKPKNYRIKRLNEYRTALDNCMERLAVVMQNYDYVEVGSSVKDHTNAENSNALSFRFNAGTFFDVYSPASVFNTEYLIQYSTRGTFRQTAIDQLSSFYTWHRAQNNMVHQARDYFNYSTQHSFLGGNINTTIYRDKKERYEYLVTQIGQVKGGEKVEGKLRSASKKTAEFNGQSAQLPSMGGSESGGMGGGGFTVEGASDVATDTTLPTSSATEAAEPTDGVKGSASGEAETVAPDKVSNWDISVKNDFNLQSVVGGIIQQAKDLFFQQAKAIILKASESLFLKSSKHVCIEAKQDLYLKAGGTLYINADNLVIRTVSGNIQRLVGYAGIDEYVEKNGIDLLKNEDGDPYKDENGDYITMAGDEAVSVKMPTPQKGTIVEFLKPGPIYVPTPKLVEGDNSLFTDFLKDMNLDPITNLTDILDGSALSDALGDSLLSTFGEGDLGKFITDVATSGLEQMLDAGLDALPGAGELLDTVGDINDQLNAFVDELIEIKKSSVEVVGPDLSYIVTYKLPEAPATAVITYPTELLDYPKVSVPKPASTGSNDLRNMPVLPKARIEPLWQNGVDMNTPTTPAEGTQDA